MFNPLKGFPAGDIFKYHRDTLEGAFVPPSGRLRGCLPVRGYTFFVRPLEGVLTPPPGGFPR